MQENKRDSTQGIINVARSGSVVARPPKGMKVKPGGASSDKIQPPRNGG